MELGIEVLDDGDWNMLDIELEHVYLDRMIDIMEQDTVQDVRWRKPVDDEDGLGDTLEGQDDVKDVGVEVRDDSLMCMKTIPHRSSNS